MAEWVKKQNEVARAFLDAIPQRPQIERRLTELWNYERYSPPTEEGGKYFYFKNDGLQNQSVLYVADAYNAEGRVLDRSERVVGRRHDCHAGVRPAATTAAIWPTPARRPAAIGDRFTCWKSIPGKLIDDR